MANNKGQQGECVYQAHTPKGEHPMHDTNGLSSLGEKWIHTTVGLNVCVQGSLCIGV